MTARAERVDVLVIGAGPRAWPLRRRAAERGCATYCSWTRARSRRTDLAAEPDKAAAPAMYGAG